jgi:hypothetical protein
VLLAGSILRIDYLFQVDFLREPFRLGGLFVVFSEAILQYGFVLPVMISSCCDESPADRIDRAYACVMYLEQFHCLGCLSEKTKRLK